MGFGQFCPVAVACEIFAERWTPIILRELLSGSHRFNELHRHMPLMSRALLTRRLRELEAAGVIRSAPSRKGRPREYHLTESGQEFRAAVEALGTWGQRWTVRVRPENLNAGLLMWNVRRRMALEQLPEGRVVACFEFRGLPAGHRGAHKFWLMLERSACELCLTDPGQEVDVYVTADLAAMARVWLGDLSITAAVREKKIRISGKPALTKRFLSWLPRSHYAPVPRPSAGFPARADGHPADPAR